MLKNLPKYIKNLRKPNCVIFQCDQNDNQVLNLPKFYIYNTLNNKEVNLPLLILNTIRDNLSNENRIYYPKVFS